MNRSGSNGKPTQAPQARVFPGDEWERYEGEGDARWEAFVLYRDMPANGEERSLEVVAARLAKSGSLVRRWSAEDGWLNRTAAYSRHIDSLKHAAREQELESMVAGEAQNLAASRVLIGQVVTAGLKAVDKANREGRDPFEGWDMRERVRAGVAALKALPAIVQAERLVAGQSTANVGGHDGGNVNAGANAGVEGMDRGQLEAYLLGHEDRLAAAAPKELVE